VTDDRDDDDRPDRLIPDWQKPLRVHRREGDAPAPGPGASRPVYVADFHRPALLADSVATPRIFMLVDLDNASGLWPHPPSNDTRLRALAVQTELEKARSQDIWDVRLAVITRISATSADLSLLRFGGISMATTLRLQARESEVLYPFGHGLTVRNTRIAEAIIGRRILTTTNVNTATPLVGPNPASAPVVPAVGDVLIRATGLGNQSAVLNLGLHYTAGEGAAQG